MTLLASHDAGEAQASSPAPVVVVERLSRTFGQRAPLRDVSFEVQSGTMFGVAGANGSGKTVLLRLLASLDRPTSGRALILGSDTSREASTVRKKIGYLPEEPKLYEGITAQQYLDFVAKARGLNKHMRASAVPTFLQVVGLEDKRSQDVRLLSPGERRRLALAGALLHEPEIVLLDDPLRGLDSFARLEQLEVLRELRRLGATMVLTATRPEDILEVCDEMAILREGELAWRGTSADAEALAAPERSDAVPVHLEVLDGLEAAIILLKQHRDVLDLELEDDGITVRFLFRGERDGVSGLLPQLVRAGCRLAHFGIDRRSAGAALGALLPS